jgi:hypothetical protein
MAISLKERAKQLQNSLPFMENREKGEMKRIVNMPATIREYGFLQDDKNKTYVCFIIDEDPQNFYFGGQVLTDNMQELENDGYHEEIVANGLPVLFGMKMSKNKKEYVTVTFYPEPIVPEKAKK